MKPISLLNEIFDIKIKKQISFTDKFKFFSKPNEFATANPCCQLKKSDFVREIIFSQLKNDVTNLQFKDGRHL